MLQKKTYYSCSLNKRVFFSKIWYSGDFYRFLSEYPMILTDFLLPGSGSASLIRIRKDKMMLIRPDPGTDPTSLVYLRMLYQWKLHGYYTSRYNIIPHTDTGWIKKNDSSSYFDQMYNMLGSDLKLKRFLDWTSDSTITSIDSTTTLSPVWPRIRPHLTFGFSVDMKSWYRSDLFFFFFLNLVRLINCRKSRGLCHKWLFLEN